MNTRLLAFMSIILLSLPKVSAFNGRILSDTTRIIVGCSIPNDEKMYAVKKTMLSDTQIKVISYCSIHNVFLAEEYGISVNADSKMYDVRKARL